MTDKIYYIKKAYELLERVTPLTYDCGKLCSGRCCKGDSDTGMWVFPYEEELLADVDGFTLKDCDGNMGYKMVVCNGSCDRKKRPLACRIYPFFPMITDGGYDVRADIRGISSCPVLYENIKPDYAFIRQVRKIARLFDRDETLRNYISDINLMLDETENFAKEMTHGKIY